MLWWYMMRGGCLHRVFSSPHQGALNISSNFNSIPASYSLLCCYIFLRWRMRLPVQENFHGCRLAAADKRVSLPWPPKPDRVKVSVSCHESGPGWERHECCLGSWSRVTECWRVRAGSVVTRARIFTWFTHSWVTQYYKILLQSSHYLMQSGNRFQKAWNQAFHFYFWTPL